MTYKIDGISFYGHPSTKPASLGNRFKWCRHIWKNLSKVCRECELCGIVQIKDPCEKVWKSI
jgi:hypothetical protein